MLRFFKTIVLRALRAAGYDLVRAPRFHGPILPSWLRRRRADDAIVHIVKAHLASAPGAVGQPALGERWAAYAERLRSRIATITTAEELLALGQSHDAGVENYFDPDTLMQWCRTVDLGLHDSLAPELFRAFSSFRSPRLALNTVDYRGRPLDFVTLCAAQTILQLLDQLPERPRVLCDIGGGTGKYAHAWASNAVHRPELIIIVDTPETLIYADALLRSEYGDRVQYLARPDEMPAMYQGHNSWSPRPSPRWRLIRSFFTPGLRSGAQLIYAHGEGPAEPALSPIGHGANGWLALLEIARCRRDEPSYRAALAFADTMPFIPKEAWQLARWLAELTGAEADQERFRALDRLRRAGTEAILR